MSALLRDVGSTRYLAGINEAFGLLADIFRRLSG
jgi:hypothetical protein